MQTEIDHFLIEQNSLLMQQNSLLSEQNKVLSQQVNSLKTILTGYIEVEQKLQQENQSQLALNAGLQLELHKLEQANFSQDLQKNFQANLMDQLQKQLTQALIQLDLNDIINNLVTKAIMPLQRTISAQQTELEQALLRISQLNVSQTIGEDLEAQSKQISKLETTLGTLTRLIENLND